MAGPHINVLQDRYASRDGRHFTKYTAAYLDPNDHTNNISEQADIPAEALERLYEVLKHRGISRDALPQPRLL